MKEKTMEHSIIVLFNQFAVSSLALSAATVFFVQYFPYLVVLLFIVFVRVFQRENTTPPQSPPDRNDPVVRAGSPQLRRGGSRVRFFAEGVGAALIARGFVEVIRFFFHRPRPFVDNPAIVSLLNETSYSFPSGHAAFFFALSTVIFLYNRRWGVWFFIMSAAIGLARIMAGVHYPSDILGGAMLGGLVGFAVHRLFVKKHHHPASGTPPRLPIGGQDQLRRGGKITPPQSPPDWNDPVVRAGFPQLRGGGKKQLTLLGIYAILATMKKGLALGLFLSALPAFALAAAITYNPASVGAGSPELHIRTDGTVTLRSARVDQIAGTTFYVGVKWGDLPVRFTMKTSAKTSVTKRYGGSAAVSQIAIGDYLDVEGEFFVGSDFFGVEALRIKDWSLQEESAVFLGVVTEVNPGNFLLRTPQNQTISVRMASSSTIRKGAVAIPFGLLQRGDAIPRAAGTYDYATNVLTATELIVFQPRNEFAPRNFEGVLKEARMAQLPATLTITVGGADYTVMVSEKAEVLKKNRAPAQLARFVAGDTVRFYGALREEEKTLQDARVVDAEVIRNLNL